MAEQNVIHRVNPQAADQVRTVRLFENPLAVADFLAGLEGHQFLSYDAVFPEDSLKMIKYHRQYPKNCANPVANPFIGSGLYKTQSCQATVTFNYEKKRESRGGEEPERRGTWHTIVMVNGKVSPLSVHKSDVVTELPEGMEDKLANYRAVLDADGNVQFTTPEPRLYLRYEIVRGHGDGNRQERHMKSESHYWLPDGNSVELALPEAGVQRYNDPIEIDRETLDPFLPARKARTDETDMQVMSLAHVRELRAGGEIYRQG